jgi:hypothetical protein
MERTPDDTRPAGSSSKTLILWLLFALVAPVLGLVAGGLLAMMVAGEPPTVPKEHAQVSEEDRRLKNCEFNQWELKATRVLFITLGAVFLMGLAAIVKAGVLIARGSTSPKWLVIIESSLFVLSLFEYLLFPPVMFIAWIFRNG